MSIPNPQIIETFLSVLNSIREADPAALQEILNSRALCNDKMVDHPTLPVVVMGEHCGVSALGVINALCQEITGLRVAAVLGDTPDENGRCDLQGFMAWDPETGKCVAPNPHLES